MSKGQLVMHIWFGTFIALVNIGVNIFILKYILKITKQCRSILGFKVGNRDTQIS